MALTCGRDGERSCATRAGTPSRWASAPACSWIPDPQQIRLAAQTGTDRIELYTETYARAFRTGDDLEHVFQQFVRAAEVAVDEGLGLNAGHDLDLNNSAALRHQ